MRRAAGSSALGLHKWKGTFPGGAAGSTPGAVHPAREVSSGCTAGGSHVYCRGTQVKVTGASGLACSNTKQCVGFAFDLMLCPGLGLSQVGLGHGDALLLLAREYRRVLLTRPGDGDVIWNLSGIFKLFLGF